MSIGDTPIFYGPETKQRWTLTVDLDGELLSWSEETELIRAIENLPRIIEVTLKREFVT